MFLLLSKIRVYSILFIFLGFFLSLQNVYCDETDSESYTLSASEMHESIRVNICSSNSETDSSSQQIDSTIYQIFLKEYCKNNKTTIDEILSSPRKKSAYKAGQRKFYNSFLSYEEEDNELNHLYAKHPELQKHKDFIEFFFDQNKKKNNFLTFKNTQQKSNFYDFQKVLPTLNVTPDPNSSKQ